MRETFLEDSGDRDLLAELIPLRKSESPKKGEGVLFIIGDVQKGTVHSEPKTFEDRLFFSIVPGSETELEYFYKTE